MCTKKVVQGLAALLVIVLPLTASACATTDSSRSPSTPPSPGAVAPSKAEITAAIKTLTKPLLRSGDLAPYETIGVGLVKHDASGRWLATAELAPPGDASWWPAIIIVAKDSDGWKIVSLKADTTVHSLPLSPSSSPTVYPQ